MRLAFTPHGWGSHWRALTRGMCCRNRLSFEHYPVNCCAEHRLKGRRKAAGDPLCDDCDNPSKVPGSCRTGGEACIGAGMAVD